ncbi:Eco47II family restriction endonuclease [Candidatus Liberibacter solanacearum]|uniref:Uncharacterized protein n=1 Tax=Candidatus Liberibacter solanacearum TaxID=556287 RepID=A0A1V2N7T8_9HYPH|nr:hypothetical protein AYO25_03220 [Candidatus Liberibacter solanacearum]
MDQFYGKVTGDNLAFYKLCKCLPLVIQDVIKKRGSSEINNTGEEEMKKIFPEIKSKEEY